MNTQAAMLAALFEKSLNLGPEWKVVDAEFREVAGGKDELHVFVERATGSAMFCTACGGMHGVYDTREREWRHLDIWQYRARSLGGRRRQALHGPVRRPGRRHGALGADGERHRRAFR